MRCLFIRNTRVEFVEPLRAASDAELIGQATAMAIYRPDIHWDWFEVWDGDRLVYRSAGTAAANPSG